MMEVFLTYPTPEGTQKIAIDHERTSFGRGSEADQRFDDGGLSRLHATVYRDGDRIWVTDENSTNGTFVNGQPVSGAGTPLRNGDSIKIGNETMLKVSVAENNETVPAKLAEASIHSATAQPQRGISWIPVAAIAA